MDGKYADVPTSSKMFDESKTLVFRHHKERMRTTGANYEVVDVIVATGIDFSVRLLWDAIEDESPHYSSCNVTADDVNVQAFYDSIKQNDYQMLHHFCGSLFRKYGVKLQHLRTNPLTLYMVHQNKNMCEAVLSDPRISELISVYVGPVLRLTWSESASPMIAEHQLDFKQDKVSTENLIQNLANICEAHFEYQSTYNDSLRLMIAKLPLWMSHMNKTIKVETNPIGNFDECTAETACPDHALIDMRGLLNQTMERNSDLSSRGDSSRDIVRGGQQPFISKDGGQLHFYSNTSSTWKMEDEDEDEEDAEDGDQTQDITLVVPRKDEQFEKTVDQSQSTHEFVQGTNANDTSVAQDRSLPSFEESSLVRAKNFLQHHRIQGTKTLEETIAIALTDDAVMPSKAKTLDTILCLDTSASLKEDGFAEMKKLALDFVDGIEAITEEQDIEENIAVVAFGGGSRIVHFLSNDYGSVRDSIINLEMGGGSPLFEALLVSLCAFKDRGGIMNIAGVHKLGPRLIVLSDCRPTHEQEKLGTDQHGHSAPEVVMMLMKLLPRFNKKHADYPFPVVWIPVGNANVNLLSSFAKMSGGKLLQGEDMKHLCKYQWIQRTVGNIFAVIKEGAFPDARKMTDDIKLCIEALSGDLNPTDKAEVLQTVTAKFDEKSFLDDDDDDFDNIRESDDQDLPCLGARVIRGPDWNWENQDSGGPGTVVNHKKPGWLSVHWDNGHRNIYRYGFKGKYDVFEVKDMPRQITSDMFIEIGCEVTRGPDWIGRDEDGGPGGVGVVLRINDSGEVMVRWKLTRVIMKCRYNKDGKVDLKVRDPVKVLIDNTPEEQFGAMGLQMREEGRWVWQWQDERGQWHLYSEENVFKLDKMYTSNQQGTCLVLRGGNSYRVLFRQNIERAVAGQTRHNVRRIKITEEEYVVMKQIS